jgi:4-amino-4-deoxy-L-arabinose transferase-like glycosyltransferase
MGASRGRAALRNLRHLAVALLLVGLAWRLTRYLLGFPIWGDEAMLLVNYLSRGYLDLFGPIDDCQIAPLLFHVGVLSCFRSLGSSEWAVRLPALLACLGSLVLFWRLARLTLPPLARTLAVGFLAVAVWPATLGTLTKPYSFDLFFSLALLVPALTWLRRPTRLGGLIVLALTAPVAVLGSYPAVFVGGAVWLVLLPAVWRQRRAVWWLFGLYGVLLGGTFVAHYRFVSLPHLSSPLGWLTTASGMDQYWQDGFPPMAPAALLRWFVLAHTGQMTAYPLGGSNGASVLTTLLIVVGAVWLWRRGQRRLVWLGLGTLGLWFVAAALRKYPYGTSGRLAQHVAPFCCLLAGAGLAALIGRLRTPAARGWATRLAVLLLVLVGVGGTLRDLLRPYRGNGDRWECQVARALAERTGGELVVVCNNARGVDHVFRWYLHRQGVRVVWVNDRHGKDLAREEALWVCVWELVDDRPGRQDSDDSALLAARLIAGASRLCVDNDLYCLQPSERGDPCLRCWVSRWVRVSADPDHARMRLGRSSPRTRSANPTPTSPPASSKRPTSS